MDRDSGWVDETVAGHQCAGLTYISLEGSPEPSGRNSRPWVISHTEKKCIHKKGQLQAAGMKGRQLGGQAEYKDAVSRWLPLQVSGVPSTGVF